MTAVTMGHRDVQVRSQVDSSIDSRGDLHADTPATVVSRPSARGWCPGAHRAMASGDGLIVRIRPRLARLTIEQALGLCELAQALGSGFIDLTQRANLQLRGVKPGDHDAVVQALCELGLVDVDANREAWPAVLVAPCWQAGDDTERIAVELLARLGELPALPSKFGFAVDAGSAPVLGSASADVRIERARSGGLIVRADGAEAGQAVTRDEAVDAALAMAAWFAATASTVEPPSKRMRAHQTICPLPRGMKSIEAAAVSAALPVPGMSPIGPVYGVAFGQVEASALVELLADSGATAVRLTPNRAFILEGADRRDSTAFITASNDALLYVDACPGAPSCAAATVATRAVARSLAHALAASCTDTSMPRSLHVSGCAKGCARSRAADFTAVGRDGAFDLVRNGRAWDAPMLTGLTVEALHSSIGNA